MLHLSKDLYLSSALQFPVIFVMQMLNLGTQGSREQEIWQKIWPGSKKKVILFLNLYHLGSTTLFISKIWPGSKKKDPQAFICHFYNTYFAQTAGGRMIGRKVRLHTYMHIWSKTGIKPFIWCLIRVFLFFTIWCRYLRRS